jgi:ribonuclease HI
MSYSNGKQCVMLHAYSSLIADSDQTDADFAQCASKYLAMGGSVAEPFLARLIARASEYMTSQLSCMMGGAGAGAGADAATVSDAGTLSRSSTGQSMISRITRKTTTDSQISAVSSFHDSNTIEIDEPSMTYNMNDDNTALNVFCEGTSINIGTSNARSACGIYAKYIRDNYAIKEWKKSFALSREEPASNQRAELRVFYAALNSIERIKSENPHLSTFNLHITSKYAYNCATDWGRAWAANKWKRAEGPIKNVDIVRPLYEKLEQMSYVTVHVFQREKKKAGAEQDVPEGFTFARDLAIKTLSGVSPL